MKKRYLIPFCLACLSGSVQAETSLDVAARLARSGAYQLAYQHVERDQPAHGAATWAQWEALRLALLVDLQREPEVLQRLAQSPVLPKDAVALYLPGARAALNSNDSVSARRYLAKFLWSGPTSGDAVDAAQSAALSSVVGDAARILNAERATLFLNDEKTGELWSKFGTGLEGQQIRLPNHAGIAGAVFSSGKTLNIPDAYADPRFNIASDQKSGYFTRSILCVPVFAANGKVIGVLQALNKRSGPFSSDDEPRLRAAAAQAAQVLAGAAGNGADFVEHNLKEARRLVIASFLAERRADQAYLALMRYRQDYAPLAMEEIAVYGEKLLLADGVAEASNWLAQLDQQHPLNLLVHMLSGQLSPEAAVSAARLAIEPPAPPPPDKTTRKTVKTAPPPNKPVGKELAGYWAIIGKAGEQLKNPALQAESLERRLNLAGLAEAGLYGAQPATLWRIYEELGLATANRAHLLIGEDHRWLELAVNSAAPAPLAARALFGFLTQRGARAEIRNAAKVRLVAMLMQKGLDIAAVRLFAGDADAEVMLLEQLQASEKARRSEVLSAFGQAAAGRGEHLRAAEYHLRAATSRDHKRAAENLARAGLHDDARRLYEGWDKP